jgi:hypothetical protein
MLHAVRKIFKITRNKLALRHIHVKNAENFTASESEKLVAHPILNFIKTAFVYVVKSRGERELRCFWLLGCQQQ